MKFVTFLFTATDAIEMWIQLLMKQTNGDDKFLHSASGNSRREKEKSTLGDRFEHHVLTT